MTLEWVSYNFVVGADMPLPEQAERKPSAAWVAGWNTYILNGHKHNPFESTTQDHHDYEDGWAAAERTVKDRFASSTGITNDSRRTTWRAA